MTLRTKGPPHLHFTHTHYTRLDQTSPHFGQIFGQTFDQTFVEVLSTCCRAGSNQVRPPKKKPPLFTPLPLTHSHFHSHPSLARAPLPSQPTFDQSLAKVFPMAPKHKQPQHFFARVNPVNEAGERGKRETLAYKRCSQPPHAPFVTDGCGRGCNECGGRIQRRSYS